MVKRMSTPDIYVAYYAFTWRVYGFLAGCKGMRRKNAGANDSWVDRRCVRRHKFDTCHFPFFRPLPHRTRIQKDIWTARREGVRVWTRRKEEYTLEIFLIVPFRGFLTVLSSSKTVISSYIDEIRNEGARTIYDRGFDEGYIFLTAKIYVPPISTIWISNISIMEWKMEWKIWQF